MNIPPSVKIGAHTYKVVWREMDICEQIDREKMEICVNPQHAKSVQESTFFHEVLHGINNELDHELLDSLAEQLYLFLTENDLLK